VDPRGLGWDSAINYQLGEQDALTADAVENFLRQNEIPIQVDKGGMYWKNVDLKLWSWFILLLVALLGDEDEEEVPEDEKLTFLARANVGVRFPHHVSQTVD